MKLFIILILLFLSINCNSIELGEEIYTVQVYSSPDYEKSKNKAKEFKKFNEEVFLWNKSINGIIYYRICVGIWNSFKEAKIKRDEIRVLSPDSFVQTLVKSNH